MAFLLKFYQRSLMNHPLKVQCVQTGFLMGLGDVIAQKCIEKRTNDAMDWKRTVRFTSVGFCVAGPGLRMWYSFLNKKIGTSGKAVAMKKVVVDQFVFAPTFLLFLVGSLSYMQCNDVQLVSEDLQRNYPDILKTNYYLWPWVQMVNFYMVPFQYQVLVVQVVAVFWNTYLSWKTNKAVETT